MNQFQIKQKILVIRMPRELDRSQCRIDPYGSGPTGGAEEYSAGRI